MLFKLILINKMVIGGHTINSFIFCIQSHSFVFVSGGWVGSGSWGFSPSFDMIGANTISQHVND